MKKFIIAFALLLPLALIVGEGALIYNIVGIAYALVLYRLAHTAKGKKFVNDLSEYTEFLTNKIYKL